MQRVLEHARLLGNMSHRTSTRAEIYSLRHPDTGEIRYIGKAANTYKRLKSHLRDSSRRNTPVYCWMRSLGKPPHAIVEAVAIGPDWQSLEKQVITQYKADGARLLNVAEGGDEPFCSREVRHRNGVKLNESLLVGYRAALRVLGADCRLMDRLGNASRAERGRAIAAMIRAKSPEEKRLFNDRILEKRPKWLTEI